jgi:hypothetical protein
MKKIIAFIKNGFHLLVGFVWSVLIYFLFVFDNASSILSPRSKPYFKEFYVYHRWQKLALIRLVLFIFVYLIILWLTD